MLPWEHLAVGYVAYSLLLHAAYRRRPAGLPAVVLAVATQLPDLIDKPLGWWLGVLPSVGLGHSLFFAVPLVGLAWALAGGRYALPLGVGVASHLVTDAVYSVLLGGSVEYRFLLWPLVEQPTTPSPGLFAEARYWIGRYFEYLASPEGATYLGFELALLGSALLLWFYDGFPGLAPSSYRHGGGQTSGYRAK